MRAIAAVLLLVGSNVFMTFAWYYHTQQKRWPLLAAIGLSWLIALPEYVLQVPANRIGYKGMGGPFTLTQLKIIQEAVTLTVFVLFAVMVAKERPRPTDVVALMLVFAAVVVAVLGRGEPVRP